MLSEKGEALPIQHLCETVRFAASESPRQWYAAYTMSRHERSVATHCEKIGVEHFLPVYSTQRAWKNRTTVQLQLPLFPNYIFVRLSAAEHVPLLRLPGVLSTVGTSAGPAVISDSDMDSLRRIVSYKAIEPHPYLSAGDKVRVKAGPLEGVTGVIQRKLGGLRFIVTLDLIGKSIALNIEGHALELFDLARCNPNFPREIAIA